MKYQKGEYYFDIACVLNEHINKYMKSMIEHNYSEYLKNLSLNIKFDKKGENVSVNFKWE